MPVTPFQVNTECYATDEQGANGILIISLIYVIIIETDNERNCGNDSSDFLLLAVALKYN